MSDREAAASRALATAGEPAPAAARLTELAPKPYRILKISKLTRLQFILGPATRIGTELRDRVRSWRVDAKEKSARDARILRQEEGHMPAEGRSICLYAHYCASGRVSEMVLRQLETYTLLGFDVVFVSAAPAVPAADWAAVLERCTCALQRRNYALDFGSWSDAARALRGRLAGADELLLTNDSLLGPIRPMDPVFAALRAGGDGLFGLTESVQHSIHLQSYLLLARGRSAVDDLLGFLDAMPLSARKATVIEAGELALCDYMAARGHHVAALYGYEALERAVLADAAETRRLLACTPSSGLRHTLMMPEEDRPLQLRRLLFDMPLNPTHHYWSPLIRLFGFPFIKTELVAKNPARVVDAADWEAMVPPDAPCPVPVLSEHLRLLRETPERH